MRLLTYHLGRIFFAVPFLMFGLNHFMYAKMMAGLVPHWVPGGITWIYLTGAFEIIAALSIITKIQARLVCFLLAVLLLVYILTLDLPGMGSADQNMKMAAMVSLFKNIGLLGGALFLAGELGKKD